MSTRDDIISIKNGLITLGEAIANLSVHADDSDRLVNASKSINFAGLKRTQSTEKVYNGVDSAIQKC